MHAPAGAIGRPIRHAGTLANGAVRDASRPAAKLAPVPDARAPVHRVGFARAYTANPYRLPAMDRTLLKGAQRVADQPTPRTAAESQAVAGLAAVRAGAAG